MKGGSSFPYASGCLSSPANGQNAARDAKYDRSRGPSRGHGRGYDPALYLYPACGLESVLCGVSTKTGNGGAISLDPGPGICRDVSKDPIRQWFARQQSNFVGLVGLGFDSGLDRDLQLLQRPPLPCRRPLSTDSQQQQRQAKWVYVTDSCLDHLRLGSYEGSADESRGRRR